MFMMYGSKLFFSNIIVISLIVVLNQSNEADSAAIHIQKRAIAKYTTKYDNIDVDGILSSQRLLRNYVNCLLEAGPCTADGKVLKSYLPDALTTECSKCSDTQKKIAGKVFAELLLYHKDDWKKLTDKYDPEGTFQKKYMNEDDDEDYTDLENA